METTIGFRGLGLVLRQFGVSQKQGYLFGGGPYNRDYSIYWGLFWGLPVLGNYQFLLVQKVEGRAYWYFRWSEYKNELFLGAYTLNPKLV